MRLGSRIFMSESSNNRAGKYLQLSGIIVYRVSDTKVKGSNKSTKDSKMAEPRRNGRIGKVLQLDEPRFHAMIATICNAIAILERFYRTATKPKSQPKLHFESLKSIMKHTVDRQRKQNRF